MCKKCVEAGVITYENAVRLNRMVCMIYKGYFKTVYDERPDEEKIDALRIQCVRDIEKIVRMLASDLKGYEQYNVGQRK